MPPQRYTPKAGAGATGAGLAVAGLLLCGQVAVAGMDYAAGIARIRDVSDPALSPDGRHVAYTVHGPKTTRSSNPDIWVVRTRGEAEPVSLVQNPGADLLPSWSPDGKHLAFLSTGSGEPAARKSLYMIRADGEDQRRLSPRHLQVRKFAWSDDGQRIAFLSNGLWILDLGSARLLRAGGTGEKVLDLAWSPDGERIAVNDDNHLVVVEAGTGRKLATLADRVSKPWSRRRIFDWSPDGRKIVYAELANEEVSPAGIGFWMSVVPAEGGEATPVLKDYPGTITQAVWLPDSRHLLAQSFERTRSKIIRVEPESGTTEVLVDDIFEEKSFSVAADGRALVWLASTHDSPVDVWYRDAEGGRRRLTAVNAGIADLPSGDLRQVHWRGADGKPLYGVLMLPADYRPGVAYPMIVQLHGGPHFAWWEGWLGSWHDWARLVAANGYVVFLPNPRGSTGQGLEFSLANVNDIAVGPSGDVMRGVDHLVDEGIADPDRLGIGGWSYGGYLTAWTITQSDRFKAAVVGAGISRMTKRSHMLLKEYYGNVDVRRRYDRLAKVSPENYLQNVVTPTLVIHGKDDPKISYLQAVELHDGLDELGIDTELLLYEGEGHGIDRLDNRIHMLKSIVAWYDSYLEPAVRDARGSDLR